MLYRERFDTDHKMVNLKYWKRGKREGGGFKFFCQRAALAIINFLGNRSQTNIKYKQINVGVFDRNHQSAETN